MIIITNKKYYSFFILLINKKKIKYRQHFVTNVGQLKGNDGKSKNVPMQSLLFGILNI